MPRTLKFTGEAKNMTVEELESFVKAARAAGAPDGSHITAVVSTSGKVKEIEVELPG
ncbi:hypothetical protein [Streptomyces toxytricini]|uniref:Uncharacterized protein n=1 Tax=Streptomyces toxytricini TaxID=67369 RepID=A0ABW8EF02_STRT5